MSQREIQKTVGSAKTKYVYSGPHMMEEWNNVANTLTTRYVYAGADEPVLQMTSAGVVTYIHHDHHGSVIAQSNATTGAVGNKYKYGPFGESAATLPGTTIGYTGQRYDTELGLYHYKARYFHPGMGRFLQPDPIGYKAGMNLYAYCSNDGLNHTDPDGLDMINAAESGESGWDAFTAPYRSGEAGVTAAIGAAIGAEAVMIIGSAGGAWPMVGAANAAGGAAIAGSRSATFLTDSQGVSIPMNQATLRAGFAGNPGKFIQSTPVKNGIANPKGVQFEVPANPKISGSKDVIVRSMDRTGTDPYKGPRSIVTLTKGSQAALPSGKPVSFNQIKNAGETGKQFNNRFKHYHENN